MKTTDLATTNRDSADVRSFRSRTLQGALFRVREELGPDASVLQTREVWDGAFGQREFEVLASDQVVVPSRFEVIPDSGRLGDRVSETHHDDEANVDAPENVVEEDVAVNESDDDSSEECADCVDEYSAIVPAHEEDLRATLLAGLRESNEGWDSPLDAVFAEPNNDSEEDEVIVDPATDEIVADAETSGDEEAASDYDEDANLADQGAEAAVDYLEVELPPTLPPLLGTLLTEMTNANMDASTACELVRSIHDDAQATNDLVSLASPDVVHERMVELVQSHLVVRPPGKIDGESQHVIALVGPTGMGKTTTVAKLAAHFKLVESLRVGLITVDTYRVAAVDQLRTYADILELPLIVVETPEEMEAAIDELAECDLVLIDTAGCSPQDGPRMKSLDKLLDAAAADEVFLVAGATLSPAAMQLTTERFAFVGADAMILTKLDEASGLGDLVRISREGSLPFTYVCDGQEVPNDIRPADATELAKRILGSEGSS